VPAIQSSQTAPLPGRARSRQSVSSLSEINVVPLVDIMLVLLIIFMVTTPMMQQGVDVNLPQQRRPDRMEDERLFITVPLGYRQDRRVYLGDEPVRLEVLAERIRQAMLSKTEKEVFLRGDGEIKLQELIDVMDRLKAGGIEKVGIVSQPEIPR